MPMQPSTHVTHIPEPDVTDPSVRFLVSVAADAFNLELGANIRGLPISLGQVVKAGNAVAVQ
jgi:hypothetical protein